MLECLESDLGSKIKTLKVDGGVTKSQFIMQQQSNFLGMSIEKPELSELTALGAAIAAGLGVGLWPSLDHVPLQPATRPVVFTPELEKHQADKAYREWLRVLQKDMKI